MPLDLARLEAIFAEAIATPKDGRAAFLDRVCGGDIELRQRVARLLESHDNAGSFMKTVDPDRTLDPFVPIQESAGSRIGRYKLLEKIGEGGFGAVFMAEQEEPVRRRVALKIIKLGMDTRQVVARFEAERQALAMMDHPSVAKVLDGGATEAGRPYFVMELVKGVPITEYCDKNHLNIRDRLELFGQVCLAVQHAHQKGLIHRDLKPTNVLVTTQDDRPVAKVIDFGIAKAMQSRLTDKTLFTEFKQLIGTPEYMSPEQAAGDLDIDTRSDVYSLGVLLYELLAGSPPFDARELRSKAFAEMQRIIREVEPPAPSTRLSAMMETLPSVAAQRDIEPRKLASLVRGELDWIVMKAMEKDRRRRYESAASFAQDVMRYLADEPVSAAAPSRIYRMGKFVRRNRGLVVASATVLAVLIAGIVGTTIGLIGEGRQRAEAQRQAREAKTQADVADAVSKFQSDMLAAADPFQLMGEKVTVLQAVLAAVKELEAGAMKDRPLVEAKVRGTIGETLRHLGRYDEAERVLRRALELSRQNLPASHEDIAEAISHLGRCLKDLGRNDEAEALFREALEMRRKTVGENAGPTAQSLNDLVIVLKREEKYAQAEVAGRESLEVHRKAFATGHRDIGTCLVTLASILRQRGKITEAEPLMREGIAIHRRSIPAGHPTLANDLNNFSQLLVDQGKFAEAEPPAREALAINRSAFPADHPAITLTLNNLASLLQDQKRFSEAESLYVEAIGTMRIAPVVNQKALASYLTNFGYLYEEQGKRTQAEVNFREALALRRKAPDATHRDVMISLADLGRILADQGRPVEAEPFYLEALPIARRIYGNVNAYTAFLLSRIAANASALDKQDDAEALEREALAIQRKLLPDGHRDVTKCMELLGIILLRQSQSAAVPIRKSKLAEAEALEREALATRRRLDRGENRDIASCIDSLATVLSAQGKTAEADELRREATGLVAKRSVTTRP